jgi:glucan biosynthesis protein C
MSSTGDRDLDLKDQAVLIGSQTSRIAYIDSLRILLTSLVICHHLAIAFGAPGGWYYVVKSPGDIVSQTILMLFVAINQAFFMSLFFFLSGYFTRWQLLRKGIPRFAQERLIRLGIPLLVYVFALHPLLIYIGLTYSGLNTTEFWQFQKNNLPTCFGLGPMWFVFALIIFTGAYLAIRSRQQIIRTCLPTRFFDNSLIFIFISLIGVFTFFVRLSFPIGEGPLGLQIGYFPMYICFFVFGILAGGNFWLDRITRPQANFWFFTSLACICVLPLIAFCGGAYTGKFDLFRGGFFWQAYAYAAWEPFVCIGISMKLVQLFRDRINHATPFTTELAKCTYTVLIIHPFFVVIATHVAKNLHAPTLVTLLVICPQILVLTFACAILIRRVPILRNVL